jgi:hypothetical protein
MTGAVIAASTNADATAMSGVRLMTGFISIPPQKCGMKNVERNLTKSMDEICHMSYFK